MSNLKKFFAKELEEELAEAQRENELTIARLKGDLENAEKKIKELTAPPPPMQQPFGGGPTRVDVHRDMIHNTLVFRMAISVDAIRYSYTHPDDMIRHIMEGWVRDIHQELMKHISPRPVIRPPIIDPSRFP